MTGLVKKFKKDQEGTATIEFVLLFPAFMALFFMGFESGYYMVRSVMLERAVDVAVRDVRLNNGGVPQLTEMKDNICNAAMILDTDCRSSLQIEIRPVAPVPGGVAAAGNLVSCIDKSVDMDDPANATIYNTGSGNQLMLVRVCALAQPMFPTTGIGAGMRYDNLGNYALVATSAFVNEPTNSTDREDVPTLTMINDNMGKDNGFGNGDQDAPGESLLNNGAENDQTSGGSINNNAGGNATNAASGGDTTNAASGGDTTNAASGGDSNTTGGAGYIDPNAPTEEEDQASLGDPSDNTGGVNP